MFQTTICSTLHVWCLLFRFAVVCAFVTNERMQEGTDKFVQDVRNSINDVDTYLNTTGRQIKILMVVNYREFQDNIFDVLESKSYYAKIFIGNLKPNFVIDYVKITNSYIFYTISIYNSAYIFTRYKIFFFILVSYPIIDKTYF